MKDWLLSLNLVVMCVQAAAGPPEVLGMMGQRVSLPCVHRDEKYASQKKLVLWQRDEMVVHAQNATGSQSKEQNERYKGRTEMDGQELTLGNFSLTLKLLQLEDEGSYSCIVLTDTHRWEKLHEASIQLYVAARYSTPTIVAPHREEVQAGELVNLTCHSSGGYPKPTVNWTDGENRPFLGVSQDEFSQDGVLRLWNISSTIQVKVSANSSFACTVVNTRTGERVTSAAWVGCSTESSLQQPSRNILLFVILLVLIPALLGALGFVYQKMTGRAEMTVACPEAHQMIPTRKETVLPDHSPC